MMGAIYIGLSGMNAFSRGLQTISNNVANMNSLGYKASSVNFTDAFNIGGLGSAYSGRNAQSFGSGVRFGSPGVDFTQGDLRQTGGDLDLAVQGSGFMVLNDGDRTYYARTGQFVVDEDGYVSLQGTQYHLNVLNDARQISALSIDSLRTSAPSATTTITFSDNLSSNASEATVSDIVLYDARGGRQVWKVKLTPTGQANEWSLSVTDASNSTVGQPVTLRFSNTSPYRIVEPADGRIVLDGVLSGADVTLDFSSVTSLNSGTSSSLRAGSVDGNGVGALTRVSVNADGHVELIYSNGQTEDLGAVALADFRDTQQLERVGDGLFRNAGGEARLLESATDGIGTLVSKQLEASNVDLAQQFGDLILVQRGFQASSQVVSVSNDMIQQLFAIRGQG